MISFNPSNEPDLRGYNYEVYLPEDIGQNGSTYEIINNATPYLSGFSAANVITIDVPQNSETQNTIDSNTGVTTTTTTEKLYFCRVQSIDTTGNKSSWTPIVASTATTLIDSAHIIDLTASKITAGTIGAHTITMAGAQSIIKSSTFDGVAVGNGSYANATTGWLINGQGKSYFYDATIVGSIDIGGFDSGSFHVNTDGDLWSGAGTLAAAPFKVLKEGDVTANTITTKNLTLTGNTVISSNSKIYLGTGVYANTNTPFYVDDTSKFSLGNKLTWDGSTLTITGNVNITGGNTLTLINNAESNASNAYSVAISANAIAVSAQNTADDAYSEAITRIAPGELEARINDSVTNISGGKITTGSINADLITVGTLSGDRIQGGTIRAGSSFIIEAGALLTNSDASFYVDAGGGCATNYLKSSSGNLAIDLDNQDCNMINMGSPVQSGFFRVYGNLRYITASTISDERIKNSIEPIESSINFINKLKPVSYYLSNFTHEDTLNNITVDNTGKRKHFGLIAQDVKAALNDSGYLASEYSLWSSDNLQDENSLQWISYEEIIPHLVRTVQELSAKIEELESRLNS